MLWEREGWTNFIFHIFSDSAVLEGPACALSLLHLSQVGCEQALSGTTGGSVRWSSGCVLWYEAVPKAGSKQLSWGLRLSCLPASPGVCSGAVVFSGCVQSCSGARQPFCSKALWLALCAGQGCCRSCSELLLITGSSCSSCQLQLTRTCKPTLLSFHHQALAGQQGDWRTSIFGPWMTGPEGICRESCVPLSC